MKRLIEIDSCSKCPHLERHKHKARGGDGGWNCALLPKLKRDRGGNHVSDHIMTHYVTDLEMYNESQKGPFPRIDQPRNPFNRLWIDNCPLEKI